MPTSYSPSLRLADIGDGELAGTWGAVTDTNICTLLESAIAGRSQVTVTTTNVTLTVSNGADDQARHAIIELTGASTAARDVICPAAEKIYVVWNNTTGGFSHTFKTSAGTGIVVPPGKKMFLFCDGTNVVEGLNHFTTLLPLSGGAMTGPLLVTDGSAGSPSIQFSSDTNTGIIRTAADTIALVGNGAATLVVSPTTASFPAAISVAGTSTYADLANFSGELRSSGPFSCLGPAVFTNTINVNGSGVFSTNTTMGADSSSTMTVNSTAAFNGPVSFTGVPTFIGNVVIGDQGSDTLSVVSTTTFSNGATFNGAVTTNSSVTFGSTTAFTGAATLNGTLTANGAASFTNTVALGNATTDTITITGNTTVGSGTTLTKQSAGSFISHGSSGHTSGVITVSASTPSGGSNGDIWFQI